MPRAKRICNQPECGKVAVRAGRCEECAADLEKQRGSRHERGYGVDHDRVRHLLMQQFGRDYRAGRKPVCWRCGERMHPWQALAADHSGRSAAEGGVADVLTHAGCNSGKRLPPAGASGPSQAS